MSSSSDSPWLFDREAVEAQDPSQRVLGAVDDVLLLLVVQLLLHDVLAQVEHHLQDGHDNQSASHVTSASILQTHETQSVSYLLHGENIFSCSSVLQQRAELKLWSDLKENTHVELASSLTVS